MLMAVQVRNTGDQNIAQYSVALAIEFDRIFPSLLNLDMKAPRSTEQWKVSMLVMERLITEMWLEHGSRMA